MGSIWEDVEPLLERGKKPARYIAPEGGTWPHRSHPATAPCSRPSSSEWEVALSGADPLARSAGVNKVLAASTLPHTVARKGVAQWIDRDGVRREPLPLPPTTAVALHALSSRAPFSRSPHVGTDRTLRGGRGHPGLLHPAEPAQAAGS